MLLNLYRRHSRQAKNCLGGHPPDSRSYEADEQRRKWKLCACPIYTDGTLAGKFRRKNTQRTDWAEAKVVVADLEAAGSWEPAAPEPVVSALAAVVAPQPAVPPFPAYPALPPPGPAMTIPFATDAYLASREARQIAASTLNKYKTLVKQLRTYSNAKGYAVIDQFQPVDMDEFYASWRDGIRSKAKKLERLKGFFKFCIKRKWLPESPAADLEAPVGAGRPANRMPLTDTELTRIYDTCDRMPRTEWKNNFGTGTWEGEDVKTMIMLLCWTGLRISDAATFDMGRVSRYTDGGANIFLRMHKTQGGLFTWVDDWLYERLLARERRFGPRIFACGASERLETVTDLWRRRINRVFDLCGSFECGRPTPHIFRHTFVRLLLQRGVPVRDVAELIGDTEDVVLRHYARWVPERQERLTRILREKLSTAPRGKLMIVGGSDQEFAKA